MAISWIQPSFAGGEIGPSLYGRIDMAKYQVALRKCDNFIVRQYGGVENRPGTRFVGAAKYPNRKCRLIPFQFSTVQTYALEFGHQYMRVIKDGALVLNSSNVIYEIATPYTEADLFLIKFTQSADVLTLVTVRNIQSVFLVVRTSPVVMSARNYSSLIPELILVLAMKCQKNYVATLFL